MSNQKSEIAKLVEHSWPSAQWQNYSVLVAVSGGADSVALLRILIEISAANSGKGKLTVGHVDHGLRGNLSNWDADFVRQMAESHGLQCEVATLEHRDSEGSQSGRGLEANLRRARYAALQQMAERQGVRFLATAHNQNDQVETILFRALRGTGLDGLAGIPKHRTLTEHLTVVRPLLDVSRQTIASYLSELGQSWREDDSNQSTRFTRNRLRHEVLPLLDDVFENDVTHSLLSLGELASEQSEFLQRTVQPILNDCFVVSDGRIEVTCNVANHFDPFLLTFALRQAWRQAGFETKDMTAAKWRRLTQLCCCSEPCVENFPGGLRVERMLNPARLQIDRQS